MNENFMNVCIDLGSSIIRVTTDKYNPGGYLAVMSPSAFAGAEGGFVPAESCKVYITPDKLEELLAALTTLKTFKETP